MIRRSRSHAESRGVMSNASVRNRSRLQLAVILAITVTSVGGAYALFQFARDGALWSTTNRGAFVDPPVTAADLGVRQADGGAMATGVWWLWVVPDGACESACREALHQLRQLHVLLNRDMPRVRRGLLTGDTAAVSDLVDVYPKLALLSGNLDALAAGIYVVDPIGNLVFHYPLSDAGEPVLGDLKRLLKVSQIG